ncbi:MAG: hypothetical protein HRU25_08260 [Psychrobium sp.]|nr:hypothetical protein [Psychrobium sp.]
MALLQLGKEDLDLVSPFDYAAIPSDTVAPLKTKALLNTPQYRPAIGSKLIHYAQSLNDREIDAASDAMLGKFPDEQSFSINQRAAILEMAYEWLNFKYKDEHLARQEIVPRLTKLLYQRSKLKGAVGFSKVDRPINSPEMGHRSGRLGLGLSQIKNQSSPLNVSWRAAYHDLFYLSAGYIPGAKISFLDTQFSVTRDGDTKLERLYFLDAMSLAPNNRVFNSWSWNMRAGFDRQPALNYDGRWFAQGEFGRSWGDPHHIHGYLLGSAEVSRGELTNGTTPGAGLEAGLVWQLNPQNKIGVTGYHGPLIRGESDNRTTASLIWHWAPQTTWGIRSQIDYKHWATSRVTASINAFYYY